MTLEEKERQLRWWREGLDIIGGGGDDAPSAVELLPPAEVFRNGGTPTLKQAILYVMREQPDRRWRVPDVMEALAKHDWLPSARSSRQMVRNRLLDLAVDSLVLKKEDGLYVLTEPGIQELVQWPSALAQPAPQK
ncbi:MAG TPA: hypothetical protein VKR21_19025 [Solirubrobacteraceae bacterium]|nr:hypothetical protein [Solirubrobacteraceae bacterium]